MSDRLAVTQDDKAAQRTAVDALQQWLQAAGFTTGPNHTAAVENECRWYAWRRLPAGTRNCECNDKPPSLIVTPHIFTMRDRQYASVEVAVTGQCGAWFSLKAYSIGLDELPGALSAIEASLARAWSAIDVALLAAAPSGKRYASPSEGSAGDAPTSTEMGKRSTSAATASGHELPNDTAAAAASLSVANGGDARVASAGCARPCTVVIDTPASPAGTAVPGMKQAGEELNG